MPDPLEAMLEHERWSRVDEVLDVPSDTDRTFVHLDLRRGTLPQGVAGEMDHSIETVDWKTHEIGCRVERLLEGVTTDADAA